MELFRKSPGPSAPVSLHPLPYLGSSMLGPGGGPITTKEPWQLVRHLIAIFWGGGTQEAYPQVQST